MSNRLFRIEILQPKFDQLYEKYDTYHSKKKELENLRAIPEKTSTDYIFEAINYFKNEYNKVRLTGITYKYKLGLNFFESNYEPKDDDVNYAYYRKEAIIQLHKIGFIKNYKIEPIVENEYGEIYDYAICDIDESKITQEEAPKATDARVDSLIKKVIHEHTHHFKNSVQEKAIDLNHKYEKEDEILIKNKKKISLPKFPRTEWVKVSITLLDETNILLSDGKSTKPSSFEGMGCEDGRNGKADENWAFLLKLAKGHGQTSPITKKEREKEKKQKQKITDILRKIFQNETDPFETEAGGVYKAKFSIKYQAGKTEKADSRYSDFDEVFSELTEPLLE